MCRLHLHIGRSNPSILCRIATGHNVRRGTCPSVVEIIVPIVYCRDNGALDIGVRILLDENFPAELKMYNSVKGVDLNILRTKW